MKRPSPVLIVTALLVGGLTMGPADRARGEERAPEIDLQFKGTPLRDVVREVFQRTGLPCRVDPEIPDLPITTVLRLRQDAPDLAFRAVAFVAARSSPGITFVRLDDDRSLRELPVAPGLPVAANPIAVLPAKVPAGQPETHIDLQIKAVPFRKAIEPLVQAMSVKVEVDPGVPDVPLTLSIRRIGAYAALRLAVLQAAAQAPGLTITPIQGGLRLEIDPELRRELQHAADVDRNGPPCTLVRVKSPLSEVLDELARMGNTTVRIDPKVPAIEVTLNVRGVPAVAAMRLAVVQASRQCADLTIQREGKGWVVKPVPLEERAQEEEVFDSDPRFPASLTLVAENAPLREVLARVFRNTKVRYELAPGLADLPVTFSSTGSVTDALRMIADTGQDGKPIAHLTREHGVYRFQPRP